MTVYRLNSIHVSLCVLTILLVPYDLCATPIIFFFCFYDPLVYRLNVTQVLYRRLMPIICYFPSQSLYSLTTACFVLLYKPVLSRLV
jgi:hypothetical protein